MVPHVANAVSNTRVTRVGTLVTYTCKGDLLFPHGVNWAETMCTGQRVWYPPLEGCQGKSKFIVDELIWLFF